MLHAVNNLHALAHALHACPEDTISCLSHCATAVCHRNPHPLDDCEQFTTRTIFGLRQAFGDANVIATNNKTAGKIIGPVIIPVVVLDGQTNKTGMDTAQPAYSQCQHMQHVHGLGLCDLPPPGEAEGLGTTLLYRTVVLSVADAS